jgi:hypothetical protein
MLAPVSQGVEMMGGVVAIVETVAVALDRWVSSCKKESVVRVAGTYRDVDQSYA